MASHVGNLGPSQLTKLTAGPKLPTDYNVDIKHFLECKEKS